MLSWKLDLVIQDLHFAFYALNSGLGSNINVQEFKIHFNFPTVYQIAKLY